MSILRGICAGGMALALSLAHAQHWESAGIPSWMIFPRICYTDTIHDALYVGGGQYIFVGGNQYFPLYRYQGTQWDTLGLFGNVIKTAIVYHDTLIVGGGFSTVGNGPIQTIACYAGGVWHPYGNIHGAVSRFRIIDGELYALGIFDTADGYLCNGLAKRVGGHWENLGDLSFLHLEADMLDLAKYQGKLVLTGNFTSPDYTMNDLLQFDGNSWDWVCNCLNGGFDSGGSLVVYQNNLYLGGRFNYNSGNVGQSLMRWDGNQWYMVGQPGGGLQIYDSSDVYSPTVYGFTIRDGLLLVNGGFFFADHQPAAGVATWNGSQWCSLGGSVDGEITAMAFYHDTLYVGCGPNADGQPVNGVARFIGSSYQENCAETGIAEVLPSEDGLHVLSPRPGTILLTGLSNGPHDLRIYDAQGRSVLTKQVYSTAGRSEEVVLNELVSALYIVRVDSMQTAKFIPLR